MRMLSQAPISTYPRNLSSEISYKNQRFFSLDKRVAIAQGLVGYGYAKEADRFCNCGKRVHKFKPDVMPVVYGIHETCKSRICDRCAESIFRGFRDKGLDIISSLPKDGKRRVSFLTLTFKTQPLTKAHIRSCEKAVRKFVNIFYGKFFHRYNKQTGRHSKTKTRIDCGAVAVLEIGPSDNVHFHLLVYGAFHPLKFMSKIWKGITGDSYRIDIRQVAQSTKDSPRNAITYILKYIRKPPRFDAPGDYAAYLNLLKGIRRIHTYGVFYAHAGWKGKREPFVCPFTGEKLWYDGPAGQGEIVLNYFVVSREHERARSPNDLWAFIVQALAASKKVSGCGYPLATYRMDEEKSEDQVWCLRSSEIVLDTLF